MDGALQRSNYYTGREWNARLCLSALWRGNASIIRSIDPQDLYSSLRAVDVYHGPSFQNIIRVQANKEQSISTFEIAETASIMLAEVEQLNVVHPTTLDSVFPATYSALPNAGSKQLAAMVPRSIKRMFVNVCLQPYQLATWISLERAINASCRPSTRFQDVSLNRRDRRHSSVSPQRNILPIARSRLRAQ